MDLTKNETNNEIIFEKAILQVFKRIAESVNEEEFRKILITPASMNLKSKKFSKMFTEELNRSMNSTLEEIRNDGILTEGFKKFANLPEEISTSTDFDVWRPPGDVKLHLRSHDSEKIVDECEELEKEIFEIKKKNEEKIKELSERRKKINSVQEQTTYWLNRSKFTVSYMQEMIDTIEGNINSIDEFE